MPKANRSGGLTGSSDLPSIDRDDRPTSERLRSRAPGPRRGLWRNLISFAVPRRGLSRQEAAIYVGVSVTLFDDLIADGRMPKPFRINSRVLWDIRKLDAAIDALDTADDDKDGWGGMQL